MSPSPGTPDSKPSGVKPPRRRGRTRKDAPGQLHLPLTADPEEPEPPKAAEDPAEILTGSILPPATKAVSLHGGSPSGLILEPPKTVAELDQRYSLSPILKVDSYESRPEQLHFIDRFLSSDDSYLLWADTNAGKTYAMLPCTVPYLSAGKGVLLLTPQRQLVQQAAGDVEKILNVSPIQVTGELPHKGRIARYSKPDQLLYVNTPEVTLIDICLGRFDISRFSLIVIDEVHKLLEGRNKNKELPVYDSGLDERRRQVLLEAMRLLRGEEGEQRNVFFQLAREIRERNPSARILALSASPAKAIKDETDLRHTLRIRCRHRMKSIHAEVKDQRVPIDLDRDPVLTTAKTRLEQAGHCILSNIFEQVSAVGTNQRLRSPTRKQLEGYLVALNTVLPDYGHALDMPSFTWAHVMRGVWSRITTNLRNDYGMTGEEWQRIGDATSDLTAFYHLRRHHEYLSTLSKICYMRSFAHGIAQVRFRSRQTKLEGDAPRKTSIYKKLLYTPDSSWTSFSYDLSPTGSVDVNTLVGQSYMQIATGTPFARIFDAETIQDFESLTGVDKPARRMSTEKRLNRVFDQTSDELVRRRFPDHPKLPFLLADLRKYITTKGVERAIVFSSLVDHAHLLTKYINADALRVGAVPLVGRATMSPKEFDAAFAQIKKGDVPIGVATSKLELGVHVAGTDLVINYVPANRGDQLLQRKGRVTPIEGAGYSLTYIAKGTRDERHHDRATGQVRKMNRELSGAEDLLPGLW